jgi:aryl-alcohol dehydrogenase-like predicted oxidoreductase
MQTRKLGNMHLSLTGLGLATFGRDGDYPRAERIIHTALDSGINFFDASDIYGNTPEGKYNAEDFLGRALGKRRHKAFISTKFGYATESGSTAMPPPFVGLKAEYVEKAVDRSLRQLRTDYIDLYQPHASDPNTPIEETLGALANVIKKGKVRFIGSSRFSLDLIVHADEAARKMGVPRFISNQSGLNLLQRRALNDLIPTLDKLDIGLIPTGPLANGFLTGKYKENAPPPPGSAFANAPPQYAARALTEKNFKILAALEQYAADHKHTILELAFAWLAAQPRIVSIIAGATNPDQVAENAKASSWKLTSAQEAEVTAIAASFDTAALPSDSR